MRNWLNGSTAGSSLTAASPQPDVRVDDAPAAGGRSSGAEAMHEAEGPRLPQHASLIEASGISPDVAAARGYRTVMKPSELRRLGFGENQARVPALLIPIYNVIGEVVLYQARPDDPRIKGG